MFSHPSSCETEQRSARWVGPSRYSPVLEFHDGRGTSISTPLVPSLDEVILVGVNERFVLAMDTCARRRLCQLQGGIHALATHPHLTSDGGDIDLFREEIMNLVIPFHPLLMELYALRAPFACSFRYTKERAISPPPQTLPPMACGPGI